jgi:hypothetical protein
MQGSVAVGVGWWSHGNGIQKGEEQFVTGQEFWEDKGGGGVAVCGW